MTEARTSEETPAEASARFVSPSPCTFSTFGHDSGSRSKKNGETSWPDLNADGTADAIITFPPNGAGIYSDAMHLGFLLSSPEGHELRSIGAWAPYADDFVFVAGSDRPQLVHTTFVYGEPGRDGKKHNYWVYNLLEFHGTEVVLANRRDPQFPLWILYSYEPNHSPTRQLTDEQKRRLLADQGIDLLTAPAPQAQISPRRSSNAEKGAGRTPASPPSFETSR